MKYMQMLFYVIINFIVFSLAEECPSIKILNPFKSRSEIIEGIPLHNSTLHILRGGQSLKAFTSLSNNIMIWDTSTNQILNVYDINLQISQMLYCKYKRKFFVLNQNTLLEFHPLNFTIIDQHNVGGFAVQDLENQDNLLLIQRVNSSPIIYDIISKQIVETLNLSHDNQLSVGWGAILTLKDSTVFVNSNLMVYDRMNSNKFVTHLNFDEQLKHNSVCSFPSANLIVSSYANSIIRLGTLSKSEDTSSETGLEYRFRALYQINELFESINFSKVHCFITESDEYYILVVQNTSQEMSQDLAHGMNILKIEQYNSSSTNEPVFSLKLVERWKHRRWSSSLEFFIFNQATQRGHSISEYEHYSYEFLESDKGQCDYDGDGQVDKYCREAKVISHWNWNLISGSVQVGNQSEYFMTAIDKIGGYQVKDWNQTEIMRVQHQRGIEKKSRSQQRILQDKQSSYKLSHDAFIQKMNWLYSDGGSHSMKAETNLYQGFYVFQFYSKEEQKIETYNLIDFIRPPENTDKIKNYFQIVAAFTFQDALHVCFHYAINEAGVNENGEEVNFKLQFQYFSQHNKECFKLKEENVISYHQLKEPTPFQYGSNQIYYFLCTPYFASSHLVCRNKNEYLEFWSFDDYSLTKTVPLKNCIGDYDIAIHEKHLFIGCDSSIIIYSVETETQEIFITFENKIIQNLAIFEDILVITYSTIEIEVYDLSNLKNYDKQITQILHYQDIHDTNAIYAVDVHPVTKRLFWASDIQVNSFDLKPCLDNPNTCFKCEISAYFKYDPNFSFLKQKQERRDWPINLPSLNRNPKFLESGFGTKENPFKLDMNILQFYFKAEFYKKNIINFQKIKLNVYIDTSQIQQMSHYLLDWIHDMTEVRVIPWNSNSTSTTNGEINQILSDQKVRILINSPMNYQIQIDSWESLHFPNLELICPHCVSNVVSISSCKDISLQSLKIYQSQEQMEKQIYESSSSSFSRNTRIKANDIECFRQYGQVLSDQASDDLDYLPFYTFKFCEEVRLSNITFFNISNQESLFSIKESNLILDTITFKQINMCSEQSSQYNLIPFQKLHATNIQFIDNQFCDICLFQNVDYDYQSKNSSMALTNIFLYNNTFNNQTDQNIFLQISHPHQITKTSDVQLENITFSENKGTCLSQNNCYYIELNKLISVNIKNITMLDTNKIGFGRFSQLDNIFINSLSIVNSNISDTSSYIPHLTKSEKRNIMTLSQVDYASMDNLKMIGITVTEVDSIKFEEIKQLNLINFNVTQSSFENSSLASITNINKKIKNITLMNSYFSSNSFSTPKSYLQIGHFKIRADHSQTDISLHNLQFINNSLSIPTNTLVKPALVAYIDNSIANVLITNCTFSNFFTKNEVGDLFINANSIQIEDTSFQQNLNNLIDDISESIPTDSSYEHFSDEAILKFEEINLKGAFLHTTIQQIRIFNSTFENAISSEGLIHILPNHETLEVIFNLNNCKNLYASNTGTVLYVTADTLPTNITIENNNFTNIWLGNKQLEQEKSHLYFEGSSLYNNTLTLRANQIIGIEKLQISSKDTSHFIYQSSFQMLFHDTIIEQQHYHRSNQKHQSIRKLTQFETDLCSIIKEQTRIPSTLIKSLEGNVRLENLSIIGKNNNNNKNIFLSQQDEHLPAILVSDQSLVMVNNVVLVNIQVSVDKGLFVIQNSDSAQFHNVTINNLSTNYSDTTRVIDNILQEVDNTRGFINCLNSNCSFNTLNVTCGSLNSNRNECFGRIINSQQGSLRIDNSYLSNYQLYNQNGTAVFAYNPHSILEIKNSIFENLSTHSCGSGVYIYLNQQNQELHTINITSNTYLNNHADQVGGALAVESILDLKEEILNITNNTFTNNSAKISGAIYYSQVYFSRNYFKSHKNQFKNNTAKIGNEVFSKPEGCYLTFEFDDDNNAATPTKSVLINQTNTYTLIHGSGLQLPTLNINLYFYDTEGNAVLIDPSYLKERKEMMELYLSFDQKKYLDAIDFSINQKYYIAGNLVSMYNTENNTLTLQNIDLYGQENSKIYMVITSPHIKRMMTTSINADNTNNEIIEYEQYKFVVLVKFRSCSKFEIITPTQIVQLAQSVKRCQVCPDFSYSSNQEVCIDCPIGAICRYNQEMIIKEGYWRSSFDTYEIQPCNQNKESCVGGQEASNQLCRDGYIGPQCKECDLYDLRGSGQFVPQGDHYCSICKFNFLQGALFLGIIYISIYMAKISISSLNTYLDSKVLIRLLKRIKYKRIQDTEWLQYKYLVLKIMITYFQFISLIRTIDVEIPDLLSDVSNYIAFPSINVFKELSCLLPEFILGVDYVYYTYYLSYLYLLVHIGVFYAVQKTSTLLLQRNMKKYFMSSGIVFIFMYFQPGLIYQSFQLITWKNISGTDYLNANISIEYDASIVQILMISILILIFGVFIPIIHFRKLYLTVISQNKEMLIPKLENNSYCFLRNGYKKECYYWDFARMIQRLLFMMISSVFNFNQLVQTFMVVFIMQAYNFLMVRKRPFENKKFNTLEITSNNTISISYLLLCCISFGDLGLSMNIVLYLIFSFLNWSFIIYSLCLFELGSLMKLANYFLIVISKYAFLERIFMLLAKCLRRASFFNLNIDLETYIRKHKRKQLFQKVRDILFEFSKQPENEKKIILFSIKEQNNGNSFISEIMSTFQSKYQSKQSETQSISAEINVTSPSMQVPINSPNLLNREQALQEEFMRQLGLPNLAQIEQSQIIQTKKDTKAKHKENLFELVNE